MDGERRGDLYLRIWRPDSIDAVGIAGAGED